MMLETKMPSKNQDYCDFKVYSPQLYNLSYQRCVNWLVDEATYTISPFYLRLLSNCRVNYTNQPHQTKLVVSL